MDEVLISSGSGALSVKDFFLRLLVSLGIGMLIGFEREHNALQSRSPLFAGARTFTLVTLLGFLSGLLSWFTGSAIVYLSLGGVLIVVMISYYVSSSSGELGSTTEFTLMLSFFLGLLTFFGHIQVSLILTVIIVTLLSLKMQMQTVVGRIRQEEIFAVIKFVVLTTLVLPFLPNRTIDPFHVFNPRDVAWVIILTSGLNFGGYVLTIALGARQGILLTGLLGGLVSSTAVTWVFSQRSKEIPSLSRNYASAILVASTIMPLRVILLVYIFNNHLLPALVVPLLFISVTGLAVAFLITRKSTESTAGPDIHTENPLDFLEALKFGALFTGILFLVHFSMKYAGTKGVLLASAVSAITDVDAITISVSKLQASDLTPFLAQNAILLAALTNNIVKIFITLLFGSKQLKKLCAAGFGLITAAGTTGFIWLYFYNKILN
ncbi:MAG: hypothetical protein KatS3mg031_1669 [Chitinophagales bacterium]|nr:MAG: hypothetical protein KatS3mg031_1669 [Chitinophagales bacterium]